MKLKLSKHNKNRVVRGLLFVLLVACSLLLSAFCFEPAPTGLLSRYELASILQSIIADDAAEIEYADLPVFNDLSMEQQEKVKPVLAINLMAGFPDRTFRPHIILRNVETIFYLQKLTDYYRVAKPESFVSRQLMRVFGLRSPADFFAQNGRSRIFPQELADAGASIETAALKKILEAIVQKDARQSASLRGQVIDAVSGMPISSAFIAGAGKATVTDDQGWFTLSVKDLHNNSVLLLAAAEDFQTLEIRKNLSFSDTTILRLRPIKRQLLTR